MARSLVACSVVVPPAVDRSWLKTCMLRVPLLPRFLLESRIPDRPRGNCAKCRLCRGLFLKAERIRFVFHAIVAGPRVSRRRRSRREAISAARASSLPRRRGRSAFAFCLLRIADLMPRPPGRLDPPTDRGGREVYVPTLQPGRPCSARTWLTSHVSHPPGVFFLLFCVFGSFRGHHAGRGR